MPSKVKLSTKQRELQTKKDNEANVVLAKKYLNGENVITSSDGKTKIYNNFYMLKADGNYYMRETERRSRNVVVMKWKQIS
jgi:hypothetical protein